MSRKWNLFSKRKGSKVDSHGTTAADEEIQFKPNIRPGQESSHWGLNTNARNRDSHPATKAPDYRKAVGSQTSAQSAPQAQMLSNQRNDIGVAAVTDAQKRISELDVSNNPRFSNRKLHVKNDTESDKNSFDQHPVVPVANIPRTSPRVAKKLIKPGASNTPQPAFLTPSGNTNLGVSVSDEYTDPFDAVPTPTKEKTGLSTVDGYVEPYEAQQMYHDVTNNNTSVTEEDSKKAVYDNPWDSKDIKPEPPQDHYEEPWDNSSETLPYHRPQHLRPPPRSKGHELVLEYPANNVMNESGDSSTSSSSASLAKQRMVRVDSPRNSPHDSPRDSPKLDKRLIRPKDVGSNMDPRSQLYSVPGGGPKYKPVDHRLIKTELSLEERRNSPIERANSSRGSSINNSPMSSNRGSPNRSPLNTLIAGEAMDRLHNEPSRRSSSPFVQPVNVSHYLLSKAKSRSLDIRNRQFPPNVKGKYPSAIPKSASDNQLMQSEMYNPAAYRGSQPLGGVMEYEEPWDTGSNQQAPNSRQQQMPHIAHSRSKSYELSSFTSSNMYTRHGKSHSFDKCDPSRPLDYEPPWDVHVPQTHLESMHRFQQRQLELHPSEAISLRDFDPLLPLEKQSWFHGAITRDEANRRLDKEVEGSYLVRNSESVPNNYSLSLRTLNETIHMVISRTRDGFWILGEFSAPFHSIPEMVAFYATHRLKINDIQQISLRYPLPEDYP
ncbi:unnamed protein product [Clavelina lepadiformis]|uniref:SH2 domain-containing protein n=1 Tax=Clavelina lepadiformis TaxID=159417 RepID=A0ABP0GEV6_CLALP